MRTRTLPLALLALALLIPEAADAAQDARIIVKREAGASAADVRADAGVRLVERLPLARTEVVAAPAGEASSALRELQADADVVYAELDRPIHAMSNDPLYSSLWGLENAADHDMDVPEAWNLSTGLGTTVAVVDSGVRASHPDLAGRVAGGHDWIDSDDNPNDLYGHGTHVAGTIGATRDNGIGVAGVAPDVTIMPLRVLDANGAGSVAAGAAAFAYAADVGVRVVNASFGGQGFSQTEYNAIANHPGTLYVVAAGNEGENNDGSNATYPCAYNLPNILCVGASDANDQRASFSNYGATTVDVFAPGVGIWSTYTAPDYVQRDGTSMATPHVAGIAALLRARDSTLTADAIKSAILGSADPVASMCGIAVTGGRANAFAALDSLTNGQPPPPDCDGDGVVNAADVCPGVAGVPPAGCPASTPDPTPPTPTTPTPPTNPTTPAKPPADTDGDGRADASDACPTERAVTADGCPLPAFAALSKKVSKRSVRVSVRTDRAATVTVTVERKRCKGKKCRWVRAARKSVATRRNSAAVTVKPLRRASYRAVVTLSSGAGTSKARTLGFKVR